MGTCREAFSWSFERPHLNNAQEFLRLFRQEFLEIIEAFRLCFLPRIPGARVKRQQVKVCRVVIRVDIQGASNLFLRSEEHTSELQSQSNLVCRLLLEKKNKE